MAGGRWGVPGRESQGRRQGRRLGDSILSVRQTKSLIDMLASFEVCQSSLLFSKGTTSLCQCPSEAHLQTQAKERTCNGLVRTRPRPRRPSAERHVSGNLSQQTKRTRIAQTYNGTSDDVSRPDPSDALTWPTEHSGGRGGGLAQGLGIRLFAFGGAYWPVAPAHSDPLWVRT